jgi:hypothetical protein
MDVDYTRFRPGTGESSAFRHRLMSWNVIQEWRFRAALKNGVPVASLVLWAGGP